ncbi:Ldh family oxidoreductase [Streptomyces sp. NPDC059496]|uniref:Ldh family oxidoreductase n=1 Tax=Streptomyces sp. NPDC059496 TaxID=3346851 RepID=UPI00369682C3
MRESAARRPALKVADLIVAEGPVGSERLLVAGLSVEVAAGEIVAVETGDEESAAALSQVFSGRRRAQYGVITAGQPVRPRRLAPSPPPGLTVIRAGQPWTPSGDGAVAVVVDASLPGPHAAGCAPAELARMAARRGCAVLLLTVDAATAAVADRSVSPGRTAADVPVGAPEARTGASVSFAVAELTSLATESLCGAGVARQTADLVARVLVDADVRGHFSHGVGLLPMYLDRLAQGGIDAAAEPSWLSEEGVVALLDARGGFGQVSAELAASTCARNAAEHGLAAVSVRGNNHIGMLAAYRHHFTRHGVVGLILNISGPSVAAPGAGRPTLGNDAVCMVVPRQGQRPLVVDFATGTVASGKIRHAAHRGEPVPAGWLVDRRGLGTPDPRELDRGGAVPVFGGHKGLGVAVITEVLGGILGGGTVSPLVHKQRAEPDRSMDCSQLFLGLAPAAFGNPPVDQLLDVLSEAVAAGYPQGVPPIHFPEQQEEEAESTACRDGVPVPAAVAEQLGWTVQPAFSGTPGGTR